MPVAEVGLKEYVIGLLPMVLQLAILAALVRRDLLKDLRWFFSYTAFQVLVTVVETVEIALKVSDLTYFYTFYIAELFSIALALCVIYEVFGSVLRPYDGLRNLGGKLYLYASVALGLVALATVVFGSGAETYRFVQVINLSQLGLRAVQVGLLVLLFITARALALSWRSYSFGIALGYGTYAIVDLALSAIRVKYGLPVLRLVSLLGPLAYIVAIAIWSWYILQPERIAQLVRVIPYNDIAKWNEKLEELLRPKTAKKTDVEEEENDDQPVSR